jgi:hypothetical protein
MSTLPGRGPNSYQFGHSLMIALRGIGHANMAYTLQIYTHRSTGRDREAAKKVAGLIFGEGWTTQPGNVG